MTGLGLGIGSQRQQQIPALRCGMTTKNKQRQRQLKASDEWPLQDDQSSKGYGLLCGLAEGGGDEGRAQHLGVAGEVVGGDVGELLFDEDEGAEVEALDLRLRLHMVANDCAAEGGHEGLGIDRVV